VARQAVDDRLSGRRLLHARIAESAGARQVPCKPERLRAIVDDTRKLMEGINRLTSFLVDEARATLWQRDTRARPHLQHASEWMQRTTSGLQLATCNKMHAPCNMQKATAIHWYSHTCATVSNRRPSALHRGKAARMCKESS
jgi:hypothetical protein